MIPSLSWISEYRDGLVLIRRGSFDTGLTKLDEAACLGQGEGDLFPSRALVLERLQEIELAVLGGEKREEEKLLEEDAARLFLLFARLPSSHQATVLSLPFSPSSPPPSSELHIVQAEAQLTLLQTHRPFIDFLPPELLTIIGHLMLEGTKNLDRSTFEKIPFWLAAVSRRWRSIFLADQRMWRTVRLRCQQGGKKLRAFIEKGPIRDLEIRSDEKRMPGVLQKMRGRGSSLEKLDVFVRSQDELNGLWDFFEGSSSPSLLASLALLFEPSFTPPISLPRPLNFFNNVRFLNLEGREPLIELEPSLFNFLSILPNLETLDTEGFVLDSPPSSTPSHPQGSSLQLHLPKLRRCYSSGEASNGGHPSSPPIFSLPSLGQLYLNAIPSSYIPFLFPVSLPPNTSRLTVLELFSVEFPPEDVFIEHLKHLVQLVSLELAYP